MRSSHSGLYDSLRHFRELMGDWTSIRERIPVVEHLVTENLGTPCIRNARSLLVEAVAHAYGGENDTARRLEERALEIAFEGFGFRLFGPRVRLALLRNELDVVEEMIDQDVPRRGHDWMVTSATVSSRLDGLLALGRHEIVEKEATPLASSRSVLRPFALRPALRIGTRGLLQDAIERFESYGFGLARGADAPSTPGLSAARAARARAGSAGRAAPDMRSRTPRRAVRRRSWR